MQHITCNNNIDNNKIIHLIKVVIEKKTLKMIKCQYHNYKRQTDHYNCHMN